MGQDSFGLIIGGMGSSDAGEVLLVSDLCEPFVASTAPNVFEVASGSLGKPGDIGVRGMELETELSGELADKFLVGIRSAAS